MNGPNGTGSRLYSVGRRVRSYGRLTSPLAAPLIPNPIRKVLSSMREHRVRALLMGGQACVFYGAAEFSRDTDLAILASPANAERLKRALGDLQAEIIAIPSFELSFLRRGLAVHFRCHHPEAANMRVDLMSHMRGVAPFPALWKRRTTLELPDGTLCDLLSLPDLVQAKKTQRDKDWPMIRRLVEAHYFTHRKRPNPEQINFWFQELRTPELLMDLARAFSSICRTQARLRPLLQHALNKEPSLLSEALIIEERIEREKDHDYWLPLKQELERLRCNRRR